MKSAAPLLDRPPRSRGRAIRPSPVVAVLVFVVLLGGGAGALAEGIAVAIWARQFGSASYDKASAIAVHDSDVYVTSTASRGTASLRKYLASGTLAWEADVTAGSSSPVALAADGSRACVGGVASGPLDGDSETIDGTAGYVRCFEPGGAVLWTRYLRATATGVSAQTSVHVLAVGGDGIFVAGSTTGTLVGCSPQTCGAASGSGVFFQRYAADGTLLWTRQLGSPGHDVPLGATLSASGEADVWELEYRTLQKEPYIESSTWVRHLDAAGAVTQSAEIRWGSAPMPTAATLAGTSFFVAAPDASGAAVTLQGYDWDAKNGRLKPTRWSVSVPGVEIEAMQAGPSSLHVAGIVVTKLPGEIGVDSFVRKYQVDTPSEAWTLRFGVPGNDDAAALAVDASRVFVAGYAEGSVEPGGQLGGTDAYVARFAEPFHADGGGAYGVDEGSTVTLSASADAVDYGQALSYEWDLDGDGTFEAAGKTVAYGAADDTPEPVAVRVRVTDEYSAGTAVGEASITIANVAPVVDAGPDVVLVRGQELDRSAVFTDPGADTWLVTVDYGDGSIAGMPGQSGASFTLQHVYVSRGAYPVAVTVSDGDGGVARDGFIVVVTEASVSVSDIIAAVELFVDQGVLNQGQGNSLSTKLQDAQSALAAGDPQGAVAHLGAFIREVNALENARILDSSQAGTLVGLAQAVIASVSGGARLRRGGVHAVARAARAFRAPSSTQ